MQPFKINSKELAEFQSPKSHQSLEKLRPYRGDAPEVGRFLLRFAALADSSITKFPRRWINKNNHNIFLPTSCRSLSLCGLCSPCDICFTTTQNSNLCIFFFSPISVSPLSLSSSIAIPDSNPKTKPLSPIHHKTLAREGLAMLNGSNSVSFCI